MPDPKSQYIDPLSEPSNATRVVLAAWRMVALGGSESLSDEAL